MVTSALAVVTLLTHPPYQLWVVIVYGLTSIIAACGLVFGKRVPDA